MLKKDVSLKEVIITVKEKIFRFHNHHVELSVDVPERGASLFFTSQTFSTTKKTAKLQYDSQNDYWKLWAPRSFVSGNTLNKTSTQATGYRWSILPDEVAEDAMKQKKARVRVIKLSMNIDQLLEENSKRFIFQ